MGAAGHPRADAVPAVVPASGPSPGGEPGPGATVGRRRGRRRDVRRALLLLALRRLAFAGPVLLVVSFALFALGKASPFDPVTSFFGVRILRASPEQVARIRADWGVDDPLLQQYATWVRNVLSGDLGDSRLFQQPVSEVLGERLGWSTPEHYTAWVDWETRRLHWEARHAAVSAAVAAVVFTLGMTVYEYFDGDGFSWFRAGLRALAYGMFMFVWFRVQLGWMKSRRGIRERHELG